jgi:tetratricopeptide (TPR) repeat protein
VGLENNVRNNFKHVLSRTDFEKIINNDIERTLLLTNKAIQGAGLTKDDIESIILIGGSTKIPLVEKMITDRFDKKIVRFSNETILKGVTIYGMQLPDPPAEKNINRIEQKEELLKSSEEMGAPTEAIPVKEKDMSWLKEFSPYLTNAQQLWKKGSHEEAILHLQKMSQELLKFIGNLYFTMGEMFMILDNFDQAIISFEKGLMHDSDNKLIRQAYHKACSSKGRLLAKNGHLHDAMLIIKKGLKIEPQCEGCKDLLKKIEDALRGKQYSGFNFRAGIKPRKKKR